MALTQTQIDNLVTLLKSEDIEYIQQGTTLVDTLVEAGTIGEEEFIRIIEEVTGGVILNNEQYAACVRKLNDISQVVINKHSEKTTDEICEVIGRYVGKTVITSDSLGSLDSLGKPFDKQSHGTFLSLWSLGWFTVWRAPKCTLRYSFYYQETIDRYWMEGVYNETHLQQTLELFANLGALAMQRLQNSDAFVLVLEIDLFLEQKEQIVQLQNINLSLITHFCSDPIEKLSEAILYLYQHSNSITLSPLADDDIWQMLPRLHNWKAEDVYRFMQQRQLEIGSDNSVFTFVLSLFEHQPDPIIICKLAEVDKQFQQSITSIDFRAPEVYGYSNVGILPESLALLTNLVELDLTGFELTKLPDYIGDFNNLEQLYLEENSITALPSSMKQCSKLDYLEIDSKQWKDLEIDICKLTTLRFLRINGDISDVSIDNIWNLSNLETLHLDSHRLFNLYDGIRRLTGLTSLSLRGGYLTSLPEFITELTSLRFLDLCDNRLDYLPDYVSRMTNLQSLNLSGNLLTTLPSWIGEHPNLKELIFTENPLKLLPTNLVCLHLDEDLLKRFQDQVCKMRSLKSLSFEGCNIEEVPNFIENLTNLTVLNFNDTNLSCLPGWIGELTNITTLNLKSSMLSYLPKSIGSLTNLTTLDLRWSEVTRLPCSIENLTNLTNLDIRDTPISAAAQASIQGLLPNCEIEF